MVGDLKIITGPSHLLQESLQLVLAPVSLPQSFLSVTSEMEIELCVRYKDELQLDLGAGL